MNLELLDPFRRQIPDRVDATLTMPDYLHSRHPASKGEDTPNAHQQHEQDDEWKAVYHVAYNRRGHYLAAGYGSGTIGVHDVLSRTLSAVYRGDTATDDANKTTTAANLSSLSTPSKPEKGLENGVTSVSWSRRSRTLLAGAVGDCLVRLYDTTHPLGPEECVINLAANSTTKDIDKDHDDEKEISKSNPRSSTSNNNSSERPGVRTSTFSDAKASSSCFSYAREPRSITIENLTYQSQPGDRSSPMESATKKITRYPALHFHFASPVGGSLEIHPRLTTGGLAVLMDGSLVLFWIPESTWWREKSANGTSSTEEVPKNSSKPTVRVWKLWNDTESNVITCASFDPQGHRIYAATKEGTLLGFEVGSVFAALTSSSTEPIPPAEKQCQFTIRVPGGATVWHLLVSRDGKYVIINCADGAVRLYSTKECWHTPEEVDRPLQVFQDVVNKIKFASCAISGDAEYVVGGANGVGDDKYQLYIWNTSTGALMDKLTGAAVQLYSVAWHPTRSFLAVATSDGLVDIWGPRINWTAFAPDFQALPMNVEYIEREDEFDLDENGNKFNVQGEKESDVDDENATVDVVKVESVPVFASDSEDEEDVFYFETKFTNILGGRGKHLMTAGKDEG